MSSELLLMLWNSLLETITMVGISGLLGAAIGIPVGILLYTTTPTGIHPMPVANRLIGWVVNAIRSTPFIILLVAIIPFTRIVAGTSIGTTAAIVPLTIAAAPFIARLVETSLREVDKGLIEAAQSMGATNLQIVTKVLIPEALPGIIAGLTIALVALVGSSAMAGAIGGGGLGDMGIRYGYQRFMPDVMLAVVVILIVFVQSLQSFGDWLVKRMSHRKPARHLKTAPPGIFLRGRFFCGSALEKARRLRHNLVRFGGCRSEKLKVCGRDSIAERKLHKLNTRVRFPSPAPQNS